MKKVFLLILLLTCSACSEDPDIRWRFRTSAPVYVSPAVTRDSLVIGSTDAFVYSLELEEGEQLWKRNLGGPIWSSPVIEGNTAYIGSGNGDFYSLGLKDGRVNWKFDTGAQIQFKPCLDETGVYVGSNSGRFSKLHRNGQLLWQFEGTHRFWGDCAFYKNLVFASSWDTNYYAFNRETGKVVWKVPSGIFNYGGPQVAGDTVYFSTHDKLFHIEAATGKVQKISKTGYLNYPLVAGGYLWTNDGGFNKWTLDGKKLATFSVPMNNQYFRPVKTDQYLIVAGYGSVLYGLSDDLQLLWKFKKGEGFWSAGVVQNNIYYTGNRDNHVYALELPD